MDLALLQKGRGAKPGRPFALVPFRGQQPSSASRLVDHPHDIDQALCDSGVLGTSDNVGARSSTQRAGIADSVWRS